jgi:hypothetical protein
VLQKQFSRRNRTNCQSCRSDVLQIANEDKWTDENRSERTFLGSEAEQALNEMDLSDDIAFF